MLVNVLDLFVGVDVNGTVWRQFRKPDKSRSQGLSGHLSDTVGRDTYTDLRVVFMDADQPTNQIKKVFDLENITALPVIRFETTLTSNGVEDW